MKYELICPYCVAKVEARIIAKEIAHAFWGGDYTYTGCDALNKCPNCQAEYQIRADFWLDDHSLKQITHIPFPVGLLGWYALGMLRGNLQPNSRGIIEDCEVRLSFIFETFQQAKTAQKQHASLQLMMVSAEGFRSEAGQLLRDRYQTESIIFSQMSTQ
jgi:hypothetical protein